MRELACAPQSLQWVISKPGLDRVASRSTSQTPSDLCGSLGMACVSYFLQTEQVRFSLPSLVQVESTLSPQLPYLCPHAGLVVLVCTRSHKLHVRDSFSSFSQSAFCDTFHSLNLCSSCGIAFVSTPSHPEWRQTLFSTPAFSQSAGLSIFHSDQLCVRLASALSLF